MYDRQYRLLKRVATTLLACLLCATGCASSARNVSGFTPIHRGSHACQQAAGHIEASFGGRKRDPAVEAHLAAILDTLSAKVSALPVNCRVSLLASEEMNAFAISDGNIYVTAGLYGQLDSDDLIAAVLSHELGHIIARDGQQPLIAPQDQLAREIAADSRGLQCLIAAGFNGEALIRVMELIRHEQDPAWYEARMANLRHLISNPPVSPAPAG